MADLLDGCLVEVNQPQLTLDNFLGFRFQVSHKFKQVAQPFKLKLLCAAYLVLLGKQEAQIICAVQEVLSLLHTLQKRGCCWQHSSTQS